MRFGLFGLGLGQFWYHLVDADIEAVRVLLQGLVLIVAVFRRAVFRRLHDFTVGVKRDS